MPVSCLVVTSRRSCDRKQDFQLQTTQTLETSCLFSFKSILLRTSGKCQSIKRTACMLNFIYIVQSKWYLRLKISVQGPFNKTQWNSLLILQVIKKHVLCFHICWAQTLAFPPVGHIPPQLPTVFSTGIFCFFFQNQSWWPGQMVGQVEWLYSRFCAGRLSDLQQTVADKAVAILWILQQPGNFWVHLKPGTKRVAHQYTTGLWQSIHLMNRINQCIYVSRSGPNSIWMNVSWGNEQKSWPWLGGVGGWGGEKKTKMKKKEQKKTDDWF